MRLLLPLFIILLGMFTGNLVRRFFNKKPAGYILSMTAGGVGAFAGLLVRDALDVTVGGDVVGFLSAAILGAVIVSAAVNLCFGKRHS